MSNFANMSNFTNMSKHFSLGSGRVLFAQNKGAVYKIKIYVMGSDNRYVDFTIVRWASFVRAIRRSTERILRDSYQPTAKISPSHRWQLLYLCVSRLQMCRPQVRNSVFFLQKNISKCIIKYFHLQYINKCVLYIPILNS